MQKSLLITIFMGFISLSLMAQVAINNNGNPPHTSSMLDVSSTNKGLLVPRMNTTERKSILSPAEGLLIYDTDEGGFFFHNNGDWEFVMSNVTTPWKRLGFDTFYDDGEVGIGLTSPTESLHVKNAGNFDGIMLEGVPSANNVTFTLLNTANEGREYRMTSSGGGASFGNGKFAIRDMFAGENRFVLDSLGRVGIGFNSPAERLQVDGAIRFGAAGGNNTGTVQWTGTDFQGYDGSAWRSFTLHEKIEDSDGDTRVTTEHTPDEDVIRYYLAGVPMFRMELNINDQSRLDFTSQNVVIGNAAGFNWNVGQENVIIGDETAKNKEDGVSNVFIGADVANAAGQADRNVIIGHDAGKILTTGNGNVVVGEGAGPNMGNSTDNVIIGANAGPTSATVDGSIFIGKNAGNNENNDNRLVIDNSATSTPLIYGNFVTDVVTINGDIDVVGEVTAIGLGADDPIVRWDSESISFDNLAFRVSDDVTGNVAGAFDLGGPSFPWDDIFADNGTIITSDKRKKKDISGLNYGLESLLKLQPVSYNMKDNSNYDRKLGLLAQDVQNVIPEVVSSYHSVYNKETGQREFEKTETLGINYTELIPVLINAIQEQQVQIEELKAEIEELRR
jgi:hypothetical protein